MQRIKDFGLKSNIFLFDSSNHSCMRYYTIIFNAILLWGDWHNNELFLIVNQFRNPVHVAIDWFFTHITLFKIVYKIRNTRKILAPVVHNTTITMSRAALLTGFSVGVVNYGWEFKARLFKPASGVANEAPVMAEIAFFSYSSGDWTQRLHVTHYLENK